MEEKINLVVKEKIICHSFDTKLPLFITMYIRELAQ